MATASALPGDLLCPLPCVGCCRRLFQSCRDTTLTKLMNPSGLPPARPLQEASEELRIKGLSLQPPDTSLQPPWAMLAKHHLLFSLSTRSWAPAPGLHKLQGLTATSTRQKVWTGFPSWTRQPCPLPAALPRAEDTAWCWQMSPDTCRQQVGAVCDHVPSPRSPLTAPRP